jgi:hypothetical protein
MDLRPDAKVMCRIASGDRGSSGEGLKLMIDEDRKYAIGVPAVLLSEPKLSPGHRSSVRAKWVQLGSLFVIVVAGVALLAQGFCGVQEVTTMRSPSVVASWNLENALLSCLTSQVTEVVPPNFSASVLVPINETDPQVFDQLTRAVAPVRRLAPRGRHVITLRLQRVRRHRGCLGVVVKARWPNHSVHRGSASLVSSARLPPSG